jgi:predicted alpha/beta superfamily hydrolase
VRLCSSVLAAVALLNALTTPASAQQSAFPAYTMSNTQVRVLPVTGQGRRYQLYVGLPGSYFTNPAKRYPVVYLTDGYWDFAKVATIQGSLAYDRVVPEFITIGLGYAGANVNYGDLRRWELSPVPFGDQGEASGHAADFLKTLKADIIPLVDAEYRTDTSYRVLAGASLGGLFTLYSMLSSPELFQAYIAATPAVTAGEDWLFRYEERLARAGSTTKPRLFMTVGGNESPAYLGGVLRFNQRLASRQRGAPVYAFRIIEDERHSGTVFESYTRGLRFAFLPRAPESGPAPGS